MMHANTFEAFFLQADVDRDGVISGPEAINFFKATNIPQPTLAKIWKFVDEGQRGFLSQQEFYNALKLVTIAQTRRELTPELVKATLIGTTTSQIPPPQLTSIQQSSNIKEKGLSQASFLPTTSNLGYKEHERGRPSHEAPWPKMAAHDVQRFIHVFNQIDSDKDGKISGDQARNLFLSWQLPREVLKNAWTLSDQDGDNMLSKREFCVMVYLLEKFTEGFPLPSTLPMDIYLNKSLALDPYLPNKEATKSIRPPPHIHSINANKEFKETNMPTLTSLIEPTMQMIGLNKPMMSERDKVEYYHLKMQEIGTFKSQCENKCAKKIEKILENKNEVNFLRWQCGMKSKFALKAEILMYKENNVLNKNQIIFDLLVVELYELKKMLIDKAKSLGVQIKQKLPEKIFFGYHEAQKGANSVLEEPNLSICTKNVPSPYNKNEKADEQINSNNKSFLLSKTLSKEPNTKTSTIIDEKTLVYNLKASKPLLKVESESIMTNETINTNNGMLQTNFVDCGVIGISKVISNDENNATGQLKVFQDGNASCGPQIPWSLQKNYQSVQILGEYKKSKSRGSFVPEDYFDFTQLHDLKVQSPFVEVSTMAFGNHTRTNHQETCPNYLQPQK